MENKLTSVRIERFLVRQHLYFTLLMKQVEFLLFSHRVEHQWQRTAIGNRTQEYKKCLITTGCITSALGS